MSERSASLRALVTERLTAAAEEIFALVERTIAEYEEELSRSKEENQRNQQLLDLLHRKKDVQVHQELISAVERENPLSCKPESEPFAFFPDLTIKPDDDGDQQPSTEPREESADGEPDLKRFKSEMVEQIDISSDSDGGWETAAGCSSQRPETGADGESYDRDIEGNSPGIRPNRVFSDDDQDKAESHECLACGETFTENGELQRHMVSHVGGKPFSCPVCGKDFTRNNDYQLHLTVHTGDAPFKCPECDARFALKSHLESHMKGHRAAPLCCPVCKKSFTRKYRLQSHMASHTGERPFSCPVCGRGFTRKDNLGTHMAMHNGKPFICAICNRCFVRKDRLTAHMASHATDTFCLNK